jgi:hypothetical protein
MGCDVFILSVKQKTRRRRRRDLSERVYEYTLQSPNNGHPRASTGLLAKGRAHAREHKEWAHRRGRPRTRPRLGRLRGARAFRFYGGRFPSLVVQHFFGFSRATRRKARRVRRTSRRRLFRRACFRIYRCTDLQVQVQVQAAYRRVFKAAFQWSYSPASTMSNTAPS